MRAKGGLQCAQRSDDSPGDPQGGRAVSDEVLWDEEGPSQDAPGAPDPEERLRRLEGSVRRLRIALAAAALAGATLALASFASRGGRLSVRELAVEDADGKVRISLTAAKTNPAVEHYDAE